MKATPSPPNRGGLDPFEEGQQGLSPSNAQAKVKVRSYAAPSSVQLRELAWKFMITYWRSPQYNFTRLALNVIIALFLGIAYLQIDITTQTGFFSAVSVQFMAIVFLGVLNMNSVQSVITTERAVFYRERAANMYSAFFYGMMLGWAEFPYLIVNSFAFTFIFYWMVGLNSNWGVFMFWWLVFFLFTSFDTFVGVMLVVLLPSEQTANLCGTACTLIWSMSSGFMIPYGQIPVFWKWLYWISPIAYALQAVLATQFYCEGTGCPKVSILDTSTGDTTTEYVWEYASSNFGLYYERRWICVGVLIGFLIFARIVTLLGLRFICHLKR